MKKIDWRDHAKCIAYITLASIVTCLGFMIYINPNNLLSGGIWGVIAIIRHFTPQIPFGVYNLLFNVPLLLWAWKKLNLRFAVYTLYAMSLQSLILTMPASWLPAYTNDLLLACMFGGMIIGAASGVIVRYYGSSGGFEVVSSILRVKIDMSVGTMILLFNVVIISLAAVIFGFERAMYTMVSLYITAYAFNMVLSGMNAKRSLTIITEKGDEMAARMIAAIPRGVTISKGRGAYSKTEKDILTSVISRFELAPIKDLIKEVDPNAFVMVNETYEVMGLFKSGRQKVNKIKLSDVELPVKIEKER
ncbi:MAG: YitT family protein [Clostridia bacterium]|nr:YitT family protein [Clostridia bacterium]MDD4798737.1 YitT family protein [Clostridia bacterium]